MNQILSMLGLAHRGGMVEIGEEPVGGLARAKKARVILVASDAAPSTVRRAHSFARSGNAPVLIIDADKDSLGRSLGRTSCAMCAVSDMGFAASIVAKLALAEPARYGEISLELEEKAKRFAQRKKEKHQHEKNIQSGKKKSHAAEVVNKDEAQPESKKSPVSQKQVRTKRLPAKHSQIHRETPKDRFAGSRPVKKGKGSKK